MKIEYPIHESYVEHWGIWEAVREFLQNAIDSGSYSYEYKNEIETLIIRNKGTLDRDRLLLGKTEKGERDIGQYGEGLKLAMLVAKRLGRKCFVFTGEECWCPGIDYSDTFKDRIFYIGTYGNKTPGVEVHIGIAPDEFLMVMDRWLENADYGVVGKTGKIYVNGLYVCQFKNLKYSYNFKPKELRLNRDRDIPSLFDIRYEAGKYLEGDQALDIVLEGRDDISEYSSGQKKMAKAWVSRYGYTTPIGINEQENIKAPKFKIVPDWLAKAIRGVIDFVTQFTKSPVERLEEWYDDNKYQLDSTARNELEAIIKEIKDGRSKRTSEAMHID